MRPQQVSSHEAGRLYLQPLTCSVCTWHQTSCSCDTLGTSGRARTWWKTYRGRTKTFIYHKDIQMNSPCASQLLHSVSVVLNGGLCGLGLETQRHINNRKHQEQVHKGRIWIQDIPILSTERPLLLLPQLHGAILKLKLWFTLYCLSNAWTVHHFTMAEVNPMTKVD